MQICKIQNILNNLIKAEYSSFLKKKILRFWYTIYSINIQSKKKKKKLK